MNGVIGRAARCEQRDDGVDDCFFVHNMPNRRVIACLFGQADNLLNRLVRQRVT